MENLVYSKTKRPQVIFLINKINFRYETENEIFGEEKANVVKPGTKDETLSSKGFYKYTGPDNIIYNVEYTADDKGFIPKADHLHPALQRALEIHAKGTHTLKDGKR